MTVRDGVVVELRRSEDRGAVAVEAALILPLLVLLFLGMVDMTLLIRDHVSATSLTRSGARVAASLPRFGTDLPSSTTNPWGHGGQGDTSSFAQTAADAIQRAGNALPKNAIDNVWVYLSDDDGEPVGVCPTVGPSGTVLNADASSCVLYKWIDANSRFTYQGGKWDPESINSCLGDVDNDAEAVGVRLQATHKWLFGVFGAPTSTVTARTVMRFEPRTEFDVEDQPTSTTPGWFAGCQ